MTTRANCRRKSTVKKAIFVFSQSWWPSPGSLSIMLGFILKQSLACLNFLPSCRHLLSSTYWKNATLCLDHSHLCFKDIGNPDRVRTVVGSEAKWSTINKSSETDIGVQPEDQKSKAASHWLFPLPQSENGESASGNLRIKLCLRTISSYNSL